MARSKDKKQDFAKKKKKKSFGRSIGMFAGICLVIYTIVVVVSQRIEISNAQQEMDEMDAQITEARQANDEYTRILSSDDEAEHMKRIAIERLGYAYPNERRFYIVDSD